MKHKLKYKGFYRLKNNEIIEVVFDSWTSWGNKLEICGVQNHTTNQKYNYTTAGHMYDPDGNYVSSIDQHHYNVVSEITKAQMPEYFL